jgi:hypothetical protein
MKDHTSQARQLGDCDENCSRDKGRRSDNTRTDKTRSDHGCESNRIFTGMCGLKKAPG